MPVFGKNVCDVSEFPMPGADDITVRVKHLAIGVMQELAERLSQGGEIALAAQHQLVQLSVVDADNNLVFASVNDLLTTCSTRDYVGLAKVVVEANKFDEEAEKAAIDNAEKN